MQQAVLFCLYGPRPIQEHSGLETSLVPSLPWGREISATGCCPQPVAAAREARPGRSSAAGSGLTLGRLDAPPQATQAAEGETAADDDAATGSAGPAAGQLAVERRTAMDAARVQALLERSKKRQASTHELAPRRALGDRGPSPR